MNAVCTNAVRNFGDRQMVKVAEELSELSAAVIKYWLDPTDEHFERMLEEYADVKIMLTQLDKMVGLDRIVESTIDMKLMRLRYKIQGGE